MSRADSIRQTASTVRRAAACFDKGGA
jgi:hypothetical protein